MNMEKLTKKIVQGFYPSASSIKIGEIVPETNPWLIEQGITHKAEVSVTVPLALFNKRIKNIAIFILQNGTWNFYSQK